MQNQNEVETMKDLKDGVNEKLSKLVAAMKPAAVNLILAGAVALLVYILVISTTSKADDVSFEDCNSDSVNLSDGPVTVEICWPNGGEYEASVYLDLAIDALPLIEEFVGFSPDDSFDSLLRIELGHNHSDTLLNTVRIAGCLDLYGCTVERQFWLLLHELTHSFVPSSISSSWFTEATANLIALVVLVQLGQSGNFDTPNDAVEQRVISSEEWATREGWIDEDGSAVTHLSDLPPLFPNEEEYLIGSVVGDVFLGKIYLLLGHNLFSEAYASLASLSPTSDDPLTKEDIRDAFLDRTGELACAYRELVWLYLDHDDPVNCNLDPDSYEPNDSFNVAATIGPGRYNLSLHEASDMDLFSISVPADHTLGVYISSLLSRSVNSFLYDSDIISIADFSVDEDGNITAEHTTDFLDTSFLEISSEQGSILLYDLTVEIYGADRLAEDDYEDNDSLDDAVEIATGLHVNLTIDTPWDDDWYYIEVPANHWLEIEISDMREYAELDAWIYSNGRPVEVARPEDEEGNVKRARAFVHPCHSPKTLMIYVTGVIGEYARYISEYNFGINLVEEGFNPQRLCDIARLLAESDQSYVFNLFAGFPERIWVEPCLTCPFKQGIDKGMKIKVFVEEDGKKLLIGTVPTLVQSRRGLDSLTYRLNKLAKEWMPGVLLNKSEYKK